MTYSLTWLPQVLESAGLKVAEVNGWQVRGHGDVGAIVGVICHHTAGPREGNMPSLRVLVDGRSDLPGPLAQLGLGRDGTYYVIAAGRCFHAGAGRWEGFDNGNLNFIGIEAENTGISNDQPWPDAQMKAYRLGVAAILAKIGAPVDRCCGHKEYATPPGRKSDPSFDMLGFRKDVAALLENGIPSLAPLIPVSDQVSGRRTLRRGDTGGLVKDIQLKVGAPASEGLFDALTEAKVRAFQRDKNLVPDGIVGPKTWAELDRVA